jgi:hypothetical protein
MCFCTWETLEEFKGNVTFAAGGGAALRALLLLTSSKIN